MMLIEEIESFRQFDTDRGNTLLPLSSKVIDKAQKYSLLLEHTGFKVSPGGLNSIVFKKEMDNLQITINVFEEEETIYFTKT